MYEYNPIGQAGVPSSLVDAPTAAGYATLDAMSGISKTNLGILEKYARATPSAVKTTTVNGAAIPLHAYRIVAPSLSNSYNWLISSDFTISERDQLRGRYITNKTVGVDTSANLPVFFFSQPTTAKLGSISEFHNFRPNLSNEIRLGFNRYNNNTQVPDFPCPKLDVFPNVVMRNDLNLNIVPDPNGPQATLQATHQIVDNVSWTKGRHDLKFGFDGRDLIAASTFIQRNRRL